MVTSRRTEFSNVLIGSFLVFCVAAAGAALSFLPRPAEAVTRTWDGGGTDGTCGGGVGDGNKWSCAANWSSDTLPGASDIATFDGTSTKNATIDSAISVAGISITSAYTGTITQAATVTVGTSNYTQAGGTFTGGSQTITFNGAFTLSGGTFTSTSGTLTIARNWTHTAGGTFAHNNGTVEFAATAARTFDVASTETFYNVTFNATAAGSGYTISVGDTLIASNQLTLTNGEISGSTAGTATVRVDNGFTFNSTFDGGTGIVDFNAPIALSLSAGDVMCGIKLTNAGSSYTGPGSGTVTFEGPVTTGPGTFTSGATTTQFQSNFTVNTSGTFTAPTLAYFYGSISSTLNVDTSETFNSVEIAKSTFNAVTLSDAADTINVNGTLTLTSGSVNGADGSLINANSTFSLNSVFRGGTGQVVLNTLQNLTLVSSQLVPGFTLAVSGSSLTGAGAGTTNTIGGDIRLASGTTFSAGAGTVTIGDDIVVDGGATFNHNAGTILFSNSSNVNHTIGGTLTFNNLQWAESTVGGKVTFPSGVTTTFDGYLRLYAASSSPVLSFDLVSDTPGVQATLDVADQANTLFHDADVQDIENISSFTFSCRVRCVDSGNNDGWYFGDPGVIVGTPSGHTTEAGGTATFTVVLRNEPLNDVTVPFASSNAAEATVDASVTFTSSDWDTPKTVTVTGADDSDNDGGQPFTITVGPTTSSDTNYSGITGADVDMVNDDDDTTDTSIDFEDAANFSAEDIKDDGPTPIVTAYHDYYYHVFLDDASDIDVDLTTTKVKAGCKITIAGQEYSIVRVWTDSTGEVTLSKDPIVDYADDPVNIDSVFVDGAVQSIICADVDAEGARMNSDMIMDRTIDSTASGPSMVYDAANNVIWADDGDAIRLDLTAETSTAINRGSGFEGQMALDPTRNRIWYTNNTDSTVTVLDTTNGQYAFSNNQGLSTFAVCNRPDAATYDSVNDKIWVSCGGTPDAVSEVNPSTGALITTITLTSTSGSFSTRGLTYDATNDIVWVVDNDGSEVVAIDGSAATYRNGTLAASITNLQFPDYSFANGTNPTYDPATDSVWVPNGQCDYPYDDYLTKVDAATGAVIGSYATSSCPQMTMLDSTYDRILTASDHSGTFPELRATDGTMVERNVGRDPTYAVAIDGEDDIWVESAFNDQTDEFVRDGVPTDHYYAIAGNNNAQLDTSGWIQINSVGVNETLNGQNIFYAVSFDGRHNYKVRGSWRTVVSDQASVHGGVDGNWYYIDDTDTWNAAPSNTMEEALSLAMENGTVENRTLDGTTLGSLTSSQWEEAGGFDPGVTTTLDIAAAFFSDDAHDAPSVDNLFFNVEASILGTPGVTVTESGGTTDVTEGGTTDTYDVVLDTQPTDDVTVTITPDAQCTTDLPSLTFTNADWDTPQTVTVTAVDDDIDESSPHTCAISHAAASLDLDYDGISIADVNTNVTDNDTAGVTVTPVDSTTSESGATGSFDVVLTSEPTGDVVIDVASDNAAEGTPNVASLTFTSADWDTPQTVTVTGVNDASVDGTVGYNIVLTMNTGSTLDATYDGIDPDDVAMTNTDNDSSGGGGGGSDTASVTPTNTGVSIGDGDSCTTDTDVTVTLIASEASYYMLSNFSDFPGASWQTFNADGDSGLGSNGKTIYTMNVSWALGATDGTQTVYAKFKSSSGNVSGTVSDVITLDQENACVAAPAAPPPETPAPETPVEFPEGIDVGDFVGTDGTSTVYYADPDGSLRPFPDLQTFLTYSDSCRTVSYVLDGSIHEAPEGAAMMPNPGRALVKFASGPEVYAVETHPTSPEKVLLRWITTEEIASAMYGSNWADYVIEISPVADAYEFGSPIETPETADATLLRSRAALNADATYELYIVNPDGTRRFAHSSYARIVPDADGTVLYEFEDKGEDMDFNDVVLRVDPRNCLSFAFSVRPLEAAWHHKIGVQIFYGGVLQNDVILSQDSHASVDKTVVVDIANVSTFTPYDVFDAGQAGSLGFRTALTHLIKNIGGAFAHLLRRHE